MSNKALVIIAVVCYLVMKMPLDGTPFEPIPLIGAIGVIVCYAVLIIRFCRAVSQLFKDVHTIAENSKREH